MSVNFLISSHRLSIATIWQIYDRVFPLMSYVNANFLILSLRL